MRKLRLKLLPKLVKQVLGIRLLLSMLILTLNLLLPQFTFELFQVDNFIVKPYQLPLLFDLNIGLLLEFVLPHHPLDIHFNDLFPQVLTSDSAIVNFVLILHLLFQH